MRFRMRHHRPESVPANEPAAAPVAVAEPPAAPTWDPAPPAVVQAAPSPAAVAVATVPAHAPVPPSIANRLAGVPMRSQMSGGDVRAERLVKQVRGEVDELRATLATLTAGPGDLSTLDYDAVAANPAAAALLPPATLVAGITELHARNRRLARKNEKLEARLDALEAKVRDLKQDRAWARGRLDTLAEVIEALHANIEDLRHHRDNTRALTAPGIAPRALRAAGQAGVNGHPAEHPAIPSTAAEG
ncbi:MAG: hypothetical protein IT302_06335 [Dehalococcoidia bacterium]|nr:hypothetical protein [Dehalococcoidia bacterium]